MGSVNFDFDKELNRRASESLKWLRYEEDVLPMWLADMDFECPQNILDALRARLDHRVLGYPQEPSGLREVILDRLTKYGLDLSPGDIVFFPGVVNSLCLLYRAVLSPGDGVIVHTPAYPPFLKGPQKAELVCRDQELIYTSEGRYEVDLDAFKAGISKNDRLFILCNPHNPVGRVFTRDELGSIAQVCLEHNLIICSDDIHCDLVYSGARYLPIASLDKEIANHTITLISPGKAFNIAAVKFSVAIIPNPRLRNRLNRIREDLDISASLLGCIAALAAYRDCQPWLDELIAYLEDNRTTLKKYVDTELHGIQLSQVEGTFLAWLDCRQAGITGNPHKFFLEHARVAVSDGASFGRGGEGFVRLNFACPRQRLLEALGRMKNAIDQLDGHKVRE